VLVWTGTGAGDGNDALVSRGAVAVNSPSDLFPLATREVGPERKSADQLALDV
jgi:hypothetical protein